MKTKGRVIISFAALLATFASATAQAGCYPRIERAGGELRHALTSLVAVVRRYEFNGATENAANRASRQAGAFQYQVSQTCDPQVVYLNRDRVRDALDPVRQAFKASPVLSKQADAFNAFRNMVNAWENLRDLVSDIGNGPGPIPYADWYPVRGADCYQYCASIGGVSALSPEGAQCVSGENRAASALGKVPFAYGCWPNCAPESFSNAVSHGAYCYKPGQKKDNDRTDITVGCYCRR